MLWNVSFFFFNDPATTEIYTLSLHDALPISTPAERRGQVADADAIGETLQLRCTRRKEYDRQCRLGSGERSEEHTSELQSRLHLVCRLLLEKKTKERLVLNLPFKALIVLDLL